MLLDIDADDIFDPATSVAALRSLAAGGLDALTGQITGLDEIPDEILEQVAAFISSAVPDRPETVSEYLEAVGKMVGVFAIFTYFLQYVLTAGS